MTPLLLLQKVGGHRLGQLLGKIVERQRLDHSAVVAPQLHSFDIMQIIKGVIFDDFDFVGVKAKILQSWQSVKSVWLDVLDSVVPNIKYFEFRIVVE